MASDLSMMTVDELIRSLNRPWMSPETYPARCIDELARRAREAETKERMLAAIHTRAGCGRDGLAGILGWIDDAMESVRECDSLRNQLAGADIACGQLRDENDDLRAKLVRADSRYLDLLGWVAGFRERLIANHNGVDGGWCEWCQSYHSHTTPHAVIPQSDHAPDDDLVAYVLAGTCDCVGKPQPAATPPADHETRKSRDKKLADHEARIAALEAEDEKQQEWNDRVANRIAELESEVGINLCGLGHRHTPSVLLRLDALEAKP